MTELSQESARFTPLLRLNRKLIWIIPLLLLVAMLGVIEVLISIERSSARQGSLKETGLKLAGIGSSLTYELDATRYFTMGLKAFVEANAGNLNEHFLEPWLTELQTRGAHIRNIGLAPGNRITYIYPKEGNEAALGLYYPDLPNQWPSVKEVMETRQPKLIGPITLQQGGQGMIYREAIYLEDGRYWGVVSTVMNADSLFSSLRQQALAQELSINIFDRDTEHWLLQPESVEGSLQERISLNLPGRKWELVAGLNDNQLSSRVTMLRFGGWLTSFVMAYLMLRVLLAWREREQADQALYISQNRLKRVFASSPQGMALVDERQQWLEGNDSFCRLLGIARDGFTGKSIEELFVPRERERVRNLMAAIQEAHQQGNKHFEQFEAFLHSHTKGDVMGLVSIGISYRSGTHTHWIVQLIDISERLRLESLKHEFVSIVSHELRTPLTSTLGGLKLLASGQFQQFDEQVLMIIHIALNNSERLALLINDLLDMEKLIAGKMQLSLKSHELQNIIEQVNEQMSAYAAQHKVNVVLQCADEPLWCNVDELRLQQVLTNLLSNAIKFSPAGGQVILGVEANAGQARLFVRDFGEGISDENQHKLFKQFSQVDSSSTRKVGGTGLGLAISKELVEAMQGSIGFLSPADGGAYFYVDLQRQPAPE
ncbi:ATP-binding protein [Cellvibrio sp. pealriver]|uniref:ATP-binding protein n=1 Tax=Cellvibrio sp. pealriver TaxID=1622269 RepID=UPI00066FF1CE|nr:ATP-binding protein [Cellvibrio sp. pealriver]